MNAFVRLNALVYQSIELMICTVQLYFMQLAYDARLRRINELEAMLAEQTSNEIT